MDCGQVREAISARLDREGPGLSRGEVDEHLRQCAECRGFIDAAADITRQLRVRGADLELPPDGDLDRLLTTIAERPRPRAPYLSSRLRRHWPSLLLGLMALLQVTLGYLAMVGLWLAYPGLDTVWTWASGVGMAVAVRFREAVVGVAAVGGAALVATVAFAVGAAITGAGAPGIWVWGILPLALGMVALGALITERRDRAPRAAAGGRAGGAGRQRRAG